MFLIQFQGLHWEEQACRVEKIRMEEEEDDHAHMAVAEVEELGMFAVVLCPKLDVKTDVKHGDKVPWFCRNFCNCN